MGGLNNQVRYIAHKLILQQHIAISLLKLLDLPRQSNLGPLFFTGRNQLFGLLYSLLPLFLINIHNKKKYVENKKS